MTTAAKTSEQVVTIAKDLVAHCKSGTTDDTPLWDRHFADDFESVEADGMAFKGRAAVLAKHEQWHGDVTVHGVEVTGPFVGPTGFSVIFDMDVESRSGAFPRMQMREVAMYTVEGGKVVREEFRSPPGMLECGG